MLPIANVSLPRILAIGGGALAQLPDALRKLGVAKPAVISDPFMESSGTLGKLDTSLRGEGITARYFTRVVPDPTSLNVDEAVAFIAAGGHDCVIGFGGGSPIDVAKAAAVLASRGGSIRSLKAPHQEDTPALPIIAVPTTAGTGSEATRFTIITDVETHEKMLCVGLAYLPTIAIVDFELTLSKPFALTAHTGVDALTHAIEAYVSRRASPFTNGIAIQAMQLIWRNLRTACKEPGNRGAREGMMLGSLLAGMAFSNSSVALVHGMSRPIGAHFHVAHGLSNAMLLPAVTAWSAPGALERYAACARALGLGSEGEDDTVLVGRLVDALRQLNLDLLVPTPRAYGLDGDQWRSLIPLMAKQAIASGSPGNNPRVPSGAEIEDLYRLVWEA